EQQEDHDVLTQRGFKRNTIGSIMIVYMGLISVFWIVILLLLCLDYYGYVSVVTMATIQRNLIGLHIHIHSHNRLSKTRRLDYSTTRMIYQAKHSV
ncbi:hypothetical protein FB192DRAFT_1248331, partial [Mucor lusitanicus]